MAQATALRPGQYLHLLRVTATISRDPVRDTLVLLLDIPRGTVEDSRVAGCTSKDDVRHQALEAGIEFDLIELLHAIPAVQ